ncbi:MAG TPA: transcription termination/antitermination NusG family protein [Terracidiphilus sp.]|nr:transcription termination/antitermination NusG family protein [Terracidiphilus sp.]
MGAQPWSALQVKTNQEKKVAQHLAIRDIEHYLPVYSERSRWTDRTVTVERPLFPGYLFVRSSRDVRVPIISSPGVLRLLGNGETDLLTVEEVERIRIALSSGYVLRPNPGLSVGTRVRLLNGIFAGIDGTVTELRRKCNVVIALSNSAQSFSVEADIEDVEVLEEVLCH